MVKMKTKNYLGIKPGDLDNKPYAKYWNPHMSPLPLAVREAVVHGPEAGELGFEFAGVSDLLQPGYLPLENGVCRLRSGVLMVAVKTDMPGVTGRMFEWWMGWHYMEAQRYKLWHPRAHVNNGTQDMNGDRTDLSDKQKYMTTHHVTEYIGDSYERIRITFQEPANLFGRDADLTSGGTTALICGQVELPSAPVTIGNLVHQIRETQTGTEMRSRFWVGVPRLSGADRDGMINKLFARIMSPGNVHQMAENLLVHCAMEMNHLASFLPALYGEYHKDGLGV